MSTSFTPIRVDTKEVGHTHVVLPILEYSMPVSNPAATRLTSPRALCSRVLQASSASKDGHQVFRGFLDFLAWAMRASNVSSSLPSASSAASRL